MGRSAAKRFVRGVECLGAVVGGLPGRYLRPEVERGRVATCRLELRCDRVAPTAEVVKTVARPDRMSTAGMTQPSASAAVKAMPRRLPAPSQRRGPPGVGGGSLVASTSG